MHVRHIRIPVWSSALSSVSRIFTTIETKESFKSSGIAVSSSKSLKSSCYAWPIAVSSLRLHIFAGISYHFSWECFYSTASTPHSSFSRALHCDGFTSNSEPWYGKLITDTSASLIWLDEDLPFERVSKITRTFIRKLMTENKQAELPILQMCQ